MIEERGRGSRFLVNLSLHLLTVFVFMHFLTSSHTVFGVLETAPGQAGVRVGSGGLRGGAAAAPAETRVRSHVQAQEDECSDQGTWGAVAQAPTFNGHSVIGCFSDHAVRFHLPLRYSPTCELFRQPYLFLYLYIYSYMYI